MDNRGFKSKDEKIIIDEDYLAERYMSKVFFKIEFEKLLPVLEFVREMNEKWVYHVMDYLITEITLPLKTELNTRLRDWASSYDLENINRMISFEQNRISNLEADLAHITQKVERHNLIFATLDETREIKEKVSKWARKSELRNVEEQLTAFKQYVKDNIFEKNEIQQMFSENVRIMNEDYLNK